MAGGKGHGQGCARLRVWRAQSGVTTQLSFQGGVEPRMLWGGSCVAQQSQHWMLRKGLVLHSAPLLGHQKLLNSPKTAGGEADLGTPLCWQVQLSILLMPTLPGCLGAAKGSGPAPPGVSCVGQPQGPD